MLLSSRSPSTAVCVSFGNEQIKEVFALNPNFRHKITLILFSEGGVSLMATKATEQEECNNLSLTPTPCEEKDKL